MFHCNKITRKKTTIYRELPFNMEFLSKTTTLNNKAGSGSETLSLKKNNNFDYWRNLIQVLQFLYQS